VNPQVMRRRVESAAADLVSERGTAVDPASYLGATDSLIDLALARWRKS
jgi:hypothetical protein